MTDISNGWALAGSVIQSISWPISVFGCILLLRNEIKAVIPNLHLKHGNTEISTRKLEAVVEQVQIDTINKVAESQRSPSIATMDLSGLTNNEIKIQVEECARSMREMQGRFSRSRHFDHVRDEEGWHEMTTKLLQQSADNQTEWQSKLLPTARALRDELLRRLADEGNSSNERIDRYADHVIDHGMLAGSSPLNEAALYLETLAGKLKD